MTKGKDREAIGWYVATACLLLLYLLFSYLFYRTSFPKTVPVRDSLVLPVDFQERLRFHGLDKKVSVIEINQGNLYFYRDGKKCTF